MGLRSRLFALTYDRQLAGVEEAGLAALRARLLAEASGHVLEIGGGTGANLAYYGDAVESLRIAEPDASMRRRLERRASARGDAEVVRAAAEHLPFADATFDTAVSTLVLCGVGDQSRALQEVRRVLRPGGRLIFIEHVRSEDPKTAKLQDRVNWLSRLVSLCDCNRSTLASIEASGFTVTHVEHGELPKAPAFVRPLIAGTAVAADRPQASASTASSALP